MMGDDGGWRESGYWTHLRSLLVVPIGGAKSLQLRHAAQGFTVVKRGAVCGAVASENATNRVAPAGEQLFEILGTA